MLADVLSGLPPIDDPNVLVASATADDAGVYRLSEELALVQTVDFFTPIVDDPKTFGSIAAANALSDIYAMGARPLSALAIAAFPSQADPAVLALILAGGDKKAREAGINVIGGHTVKDSEPKYGLAVTGTVHPKKIVRNSSAQADDLLVLTKPIGTGILTTALRDDVVTETEIREAIDSMQTLNRFACNAMVELNDKAAHQPVHSCTDITGYGLIGHLLEMARGSAVGFQLWADQVPFFDGVVTLAARGIVPGGTKANLRHAAEHGVRFDPALAEPVRFALCDAQTSGGLLMAVAPQHARELADALNRQGVATVRVVGALTAGHAFEVRAAR